MQNVRLDEAQAGIKIAAGEIPITSDIQMTPPLSQKAEELKSLLMKVKEESEKADLKLKKEKNLRKLRSCHSVLSLHDK